MHELGIAEGILQIVRAHMPPKGRVVSIHLKAGKLHAIVPESLRFYFEHLARGTPLQGARLEIEEVPVKVRCTSCGTTHSLDLPIFRCQACGSWDVEVVSGKELFVDHICIEE